ncbi:MAG: hypothetical protein K6F77_00430 [Lachnospiraceae bacterium]|nr:hypothetical protein [Lachnospiraceae bacterium]
MQSVLSFLDKHSKKEFSKYSNSIDEIRKENDEKKQVDEIISLVNEMRDSNEFSADSLGGRYLSILEYYIELKKKASASTVGLAFYIGVLNEKNIRFIEERMRYYEDYLKVNQEENIDDTMELDYEIRIRNNVKESRAAIELREENEAITKAQISGWISEDMALFSEVYHYITALKNLKVVPEEKYESMMGVYQQVIGTEILDKDERYNFLVKLDEALKDYYKNYEDSSLAKQMDAAIDKNIPSYLFSLTASDLKEKQNISDAKEMFDQLRAEASVINLLAGVFTDKDDDKIANLGINNYVSSDDKNDEADALYDDMKKSIKTLVNLIENNDNLSDRKLMIINAQVKHVLKALKTCKEYENKNGFRSRGPINQKAIMLTTLEKNVEKIQNFSERLIEKVLGGATEKGKESEKIARLPGEDLERYFDRVKQTRRGTWTLVSSSGEVVGPTSRLKRRASKAKIDEQKEALASIPEVENEDSFMLGSKDGNKGTLDSRTDAQSINDYYEADAIRKCRDALSYDAKLAPILEAKTNADIIKLIKDHKSIDVINNEFAKYLDPKYVEAIKASGLKMNADVDVFKVGNKLPSELWGEKYAGVPEAEKNYLLKIEMLKNIYTGNEDVFLRSLTLKRNNRTSEGKPKLIKVGKDAAVINVESYLLVDSGINYLKEIMNNDGQILEKLPDEINGKPEVLNKFNKVKTMLDRHAIYTVGELYDGLMDVTSILGKLIKHVKQEAVKNQIWKLRYRIKTTANLIESNCKKMKVYGDVKGLTFRELEHNHDRLQGIYTGANKEFKVMTPDEAKQKFEEDYKISLYQERLLERVERYKNSDNKGKDELDVPKEAKIYFSFGWKNAILNPNVSVEELEIYDKKLTPESFRKGAKLYATNPKFFEMIGKKYTVYSDDILMLITVAVSRVDGSSDKDYEKGIQYIDNLLFGKGKKREKVKEDKALSKHKAGEQAKEPSSEKKAKGFDNGKKPKEPSSEKKASHSKHAPNKKSPVAGKADKIINKKHP